MKRAPLLRATLLSFALGAPVLACGGQVVSIGSNQDKISTVDPAAVSGNAGPCPSGYAHPNVCCTAGPNVASACGAYEEKPFRPCDADAITYPNPLTCCPLNGNGSCIDTPAGSSTPPSTSCTYACPPGWWESPETPDQSPDQGGANGSGPSQGQTPSSATSVSCCHIGPNGVTECIGYGSANVSTPSSPPNVGCVPTPSDAGVVTKDGGVPEPIDASAPGLDGSATDDASADVNDGGVPTAPDASSPPDQDAGPPEPIDASLDGPIDPSQDGGCFPVDAGAPPPPLGTCDTPCPPGWDPQLGAPSVCCRQIDPDTRQCFSQASGGGQPTPAPSTAPDAGPTCFGSSSSSNGAPASCGCRTVENGHSYEVDCVSNTSCSCNIDGQPGPSFASSSGDPCDPTNLQEAFSTCLPH